MAFTKKGLHLLVSSRNFASAQSVDNTWTQFFRKTTGTETGTVAATAAVLPPSPPLLPLSAVASDFGAVLADFLYHQQAQLKVRCHPPLSTTDTGSADTAVSMGPLDFINKYCGLSFHEFAAAFTFVDAGVDLVSVVPGRSRVPDVAENTAPAPADRSNSLQAMKDSECFKEGCQPCAAALSYLARDSKRRVRYGAERMEELLSRHSHRLSRPLGPEDLLIWQPTSIGTKLAYHHLQYWLDSYTAGDAVTSHNSSQSKFNDLRLIWPEDKPGDQAKPCFFSPSGLTDMPYDAHTQMYTYESRAVPGMADSYQLLPYAPHLKSYMRVINDSVTASGAGAGPGMHCSCISLAWFLLTSACLSHGAQGMKVISHVDGTCLTHI
jgi:hypothetical protein